MSKVLEDDGHTLGISFVVCIVGHVAFVPALAPIYGVPLNTLLLNACAIPGFCKLSVNQKVFPPFT